MSESSLRPTPHSVASTPATKGILGWGCRVGRGAARVSFLVSLAPCWGQAEFRQEDAHGFALFGHFLFL